MVEAGAGQEIDDVIVDQLDKQAPGLKDNARQAFDDMRANGSAVNYSPGLASIFRKSIQPFMLTWMRFDPKIEKAAAARAPTVALSRDVTPLGEKQGRETATPTDLRVPPPPDPHRPPPRRLLRADRQRHGVVARQPDRPDQLCR